MEDNPIAEYDVPTDPDDAPTFEVDDIPDGWEAPADVFAGEIEMNVQRGLFRRSTFGGAKFVNDPKAAMSDIIRLPEQGESYHGLIPGKYGAWEIALAMMELWKPVTIEHLHASTLSFSAKNAADLLNLYDSKQVSRITFVISYFFRAKSGDIYDQLIPALEERGQQVAPMRNHSKVLLFQLSDGRKYVVETSANLRANQNIEQFTIFRCDELYAFHSAWMQDQVDQAKKMKV